MFKMLECDIWQQYADQLVQLNIDNSTLLLGVQPEARGQFNPSIQEEYDQAVAVCPLNNYRKWSS
jgi:hypothetical protein